MNPLINTVFEKQPLATPGLLKIFKYMRLLQGSDEHFVNFFQGGGQTDRHINRQTDIATYRLNQSMGWLS